MNPNDTQVGGAHYRNSFQHWDLVAKLRLGYFEGQITKYVTRHRKKNGRQDLDKAVHFLMKLIDLHTKSAWSNVSLYPTSATLEEYRAANGLNAKELQVIRYVCQWLNPDGLKLAQQALTELVFESYPAVQTPVKQSDEARLAAIDGDMFRGVVPEHRVLAAGSIEPVGISLVTNPPPGCGIKGDDGGPTAGYVDQDR